MRAGLDIDELVVAATFCPFHQLLRRVQVYNINDSYYDLPYE
jgi:hypothetical protein